MVYTVLSHNLNAEKLHWKQKEAKRLPNSPILRQGGPSTWIIFKEKKGKVPEAHPKEKTRMNRPLPHASSSGRAAVTDS